MRRVAWWAFVVLFGLLAMHGVGTHGTTGGHSTAMASMAVSTSPTTMGPPVHPGHGMPGMALCVALLGAGVALTLGRLRRDLSRVVLPPRPAGRVVAPSARDPDPPDPARLSVRRC